MTDSTSPPTGKTFFYLVRAKNACPTAQWNLGIDKDGAIRPGRICP